MALVEAFLEILNRPTIGGIIVEMMVFLGPVWIAFFLGIMVGWAWKPKRASLGNMKFDSSPSISSISSPIIKGKTRFGSTQGFDSFRVGTSSFRSTILENKVEDKDQFAIPSIENSNFSSPQCEKEDSLVTEEDFKHLCHLVERKDGGPPWKHVMDHSISSMSYQAWMREPENGPPQYCSRTVYEDATPEMLRDFFWDDEFRLKWDDMIIHATTIDECPTTGTMLVHWVRKFPFFCSDREYTIGRRIWELGATYYCVTKGVPCPSVPTRPKPRRVDLFYSSWSIQAVASKKGNGQLACEVLLFHHEDMGIPWELAKFGVKQAMWGAVKKIERGFRAYQKARASGSPLSQSAIMAQINTKVDPNYLKSLESNDEESPETQMVDIVQKPKGMNVPKMLIFGGAVVLACSIDRGLLTKAVIFGVARRFANIGRRVCPRA